MQNIRKLAHEMLDELDDKGISEIVQKMRSIKDTTDKRANKDVFPVADPTNEELKAIDNAKKEFQNEEFYTHEEVFGEEDHV